MKINNLIETNNFIDYLKILLSFSKRYTIMISASDTAVGLSFTDKHQALLLKLGLNINLIEQYGLGYAVLIDEGKVLLERLTTVPEEFIEEKLILNDIEIELISVGFFAPRRNCGLLKINGKNYSPNLRGLNIVVFDKVTGYVLDAVNFDTFTESFACRRPQQIIDGVNKFLELHPKVSFICFNRPAFPSKNRTENEEFIVRKSIGRADILNNLDKPVFAINNYYDVEGIKEVLNAPKSYHNINGVRKFEDIQGRYVNTAGGHRITLDQPSDAEKTIFLLGGCHIFGVGASDEHTIATFLQKLLNRSFPARKIIVQNYGYYLMEVKDAKSGEELKILNDLPVKPGDIILWNFSAIPNLPRIDMADSCYEPRNQEIYTDTMHMTPDGYLLTAKKLFQGLMDMNLFSSEKDILIQERSSRKYQEQLSQKNEYGFNQTENLELEAYKDILKEYYEAAFTKIIGSIVMNCNPFTLGHRYLIEQALQQCDFLVIFVVEEEKSEFSFDDRLYMVDEGTKDLENVVVIPSGRFIISTLTFSEYFNKSEIQDRTVDTSLDLSIFAREIAPCLHITKRFVGEEPMDNITKQYNENMKRILPEYGIELIEIPRMEKDGMAVSASRVRELMKKQEYEMVQELVPKTTYDYLLEIFAK